METNPNKKVLISYNWSDRNDSRWLFWLEKKLTSYGFSVEMKELPKRMPALEKWLPEFEDSLGVTTTHFVEHDPGCLTLLTYLLRLSEQDIEEKVLLIAGKQKQHAHFSHKMINAPRYPTQQNSKTELAVSSIDVKLIVLYEGGRDSKKLSEVVSSIIRI